MPPIPIRGAGALALSAAAALALVAAAPAVARERAQVRVDVTASMTTTWKSHSVEPGSDCGVGNLTEDGSGSQVVQFRAHRAKGVFIHVPPGVAGFVAHFGHGRSVIPGTYTATRKGSDVTVDSGCGTTSALPASGCGTRSGKAGFGMLWDSTKTPVRATFGAETDVRGSVFDQKCPFFYVDRDMGDDNWPNDDDENPPARRSDRRRFAHFLFQSHRRALSLGGQHSWTDDDSSGSGGVHQATNHIRWKVTYHRVGR